MLRNTLDEFRRNLGRLARSLALKLYRFYGRNYRAAELSGEGFAVAILVRDIHAFKLKTLQQRFAENPNVFFVAWGPFISATNKANWKYSKARSWKAAANFAMAEIGAEKLLIIGQQFDLTQKDITEFEKLSGCSTAVALDENGLVQSAGKDAHGRQILKGHNVSDLAFLKNEPVRLGAEILLVDKSFGWGELKLALNVQIRQFNNWPKIKGESSAEPLLSSSQQRWAIKNPAWANERGDRWGDTFFAQDLISELKQLGLHVSEDRHQNWERPSRIFDDVELVIRGKYRYLPQKTSKSILWVISNSQLVTVDEVKDYDVVFAASEIWAKTMTEASGVEIKVLLQATNPAKFYARSEVETCEYPVLFVGRTRNEYREVVKFAIEAGADLSIFGEGWGEFGAQQFVKADFLENSEVPLAYSSSGIVLNDHFLDMKENGFISNRVFDAAACGARILSDRIDGMEALFGGLVKCYSDFESFKNLVSHPEKWPPFEDRIALARQIAQEHSFKARAQSLLAAVTS